MARPGLVAVVLVLAAARGRAAPHAELQAGLVEGTERIGDTSRLELGARFGGAVGVGRVRLVGSYLVAELDSVDGGDSGSLHHLDLTARYTVARLVDPELGAVGFEFWLDAGGGREWAHEAGGWLARSSLVVGFGVSGPLFWPHWARGGLYAGFHLHVAPRDAGAMPACAGSCDVATAPPRWTDRSYLLEAGITWGK